MRTLFVGGGQACCEVLRLVEQGRLGFLGIEVVGVVDVDPEAPALAYAEQMGWDTLARLEDGLARPGLELVIEITGSDDVLDRLHRHVPPGVRVIDHVMARVFWDLEKVAGDLRQELVARTELQAELTRDRKHLQDALDAVPDLIVELDPDRHIVGINQRFERLTGRPRDRVLGADLRHAFQGAEPDEDWSGELAELFEAVHADGQPSTIVSRKRVRSGRVGHFQITASPIFDEDLEIDRVVISAREITQRVMLKRETEETARRFQQIIDAVHGLITIKDLEGRYVVVNPWTASVVGMPREDILGKTAADVFPAESRAEIERLDREAIESKARQISEEVITLDGVDRIFVSERLPLTDYKGDVNALCTIRQDRTRRRRLAQQMIQTERLAAIGKLAAGVAHEINNPLSGILTFAQDLYLEADSKDPLREDYELIMNETLRCRRIVKELLEFSRQRSPRRKRVEIRDLITRVLIMVERQVSFRNIEFDVFFEDHLPALHVDPQQMQQVMLNLLINARDALDDVGSIRIRAESVDAGREVVFSVQDTGCGIAESELKHIFEPFHSTKGEQGHGLGLTAVQGVVDRHGGRIEVKSTVGRGTTFRVTLPATRGAEQ